MKGIELIILSLGRRVAEHPRFQCLVHQPFVTRSYLATLGSVEGRVYLKGEGEGESLAPTLSEH